MIKQENNRYRAYNIVFYAGVQELQKILLLRSERISHYAYIVHDKDIYAEDLKDDNGEYVHRAGEVEKPHIHLCVEFYNALSFTACKKMFTTENDKPRVDRTVDKVAMYEYLIHKNDSDKYQYPKKDIVSDDLNYFEKLCKHGECKDVDNKSIAIVEDILAKVSPRIMLYRYGRDYIINKRAYEEMADSIRNYDYDTRIANDPTFDRIVERELIEEGIIPDVTSN